MMVVKVGDKVTRIFGGEIAFELLVTAITDDLIVCGSWEFDKRSGYEVDDELEWGPEYGKSGSYLAGSFADALELNGKASS